MTSTDAIRKDCPSSISSEMRARRNPTRRDIVPTIFRRRVRDNFAHTDRFCNRRLRLILRLPPNLQQCHRNQAIILHRISQHFAVPRFEDVQRLDDVGKEHQIWEQGKTNGLFRRNPPAKRLSFPGQYPSFFQPVCEEKSRTSGLIRASSSSDIIYARRLPALKAYCRRGTTIRNSASNCYSILYLEMFNAGRLRCRMPSPDNTDLTVDANTLRR